MTAVPETSPIEKTPLERYVAPAKPSLVGLTRAALAEALGAIGVPSVAAQDARAADLALALCARRHGLRRQMTSVSKELRAPLDAHYTLARPEVVAEQVSVDGTRKWLLRLPGEHRGRKAARGRVRLYPGDRPRHALPLQPGRLHAELLVLPHRHAAAGAQPHRRRDRRPDHDGARPAGRLAGRRARARTGLPTEGDRFVSNIVMMGMGEPLYNFEAVRDALLVAPDGDGLASPSAASRSRPPAWCR